MTNYVAHLAIIKQQRRQESNGSAGNFQVDEQAPCTQTEERGPTAENQASYHPPQEKATFSYFDPCTQTEERGPTA